PRQADGAAIIDQQSLLDEWRQILSVALPQVDPVARLHRSEVDTLRQPQAGEERFLEAFLVAQHTALALDRLPGDDGRNVVFGRGDVLLPVSSSRRVRPAPEPEPLPIAPVLEVVPRLEPRLRNVRNLVLRVPGVI